jgi:hypothetical protein
MGYCTDCGMLFHNEDIDKHVCKEEDKPKKGKPLKSAKSVTVLK